ncbi:MAG: hypothetical protein IJE22_01235 [Oscillibacter sp.]|nr:hypothetical protein [Oscillibacter sp.]
MERFEYTKSWRSPADFPTVEVSEVQVREDMQCLFDEAAEGINALARAIDDAGIGVRVDETLTLSGAAADARVVGQTLGDIGAALEALLGGEVQA